MTSSIDLSSSKPPLDSNFQAQLPPLEEAIATCKQALTENPRNAQAYSTLAEVLYLHGQFEKAILACDRALKIGTDDAQTYQTKGSALQAQGNLDEAKACFEKAIQLQPDHQLFQQLLENVLVEQQYLQQAAIASYRQAVALDPNSALTHYQLGQSLVQQGHHREAAYYFRKAIQLNSGFFDAYYALGKVLLEQKQLEEAIACFQHAIQLVPTDVESHHSLGEAFAVRGQTEEAIASYRQAIELNPDSYWSHQRLGEVLAVLNRLKEATECYRRAVELNPDFYLSYLYLADILERQDQVQAAIPYYRKTIDLNPKDFTAPYQLGRSLAKVGELDEAIAAYRQAIDLNPEFCWSYYLLGEALAGQRRWQESVYCYRQTIRLNPNFYGGYERLGDIFTRRIAHRFYPWVKKDFLERGELDEAISCYQTSIQLNPNNWWSYFQLGNALSTKDQPDEAISYYQQACYRQAIAAKPHLVNLSWKFDQPRNPDFVIIGVGKAGTTSLYKYIAEHPQVIPPLEKEINFFSHYFNCGLPWYRSYFAPEIEGQRFVTGDATPCYLMFPQADQRLFTSCPSTKLIVLLRNPVDRTISHYYDIVRASYEKRSLEEAIHAEIDILKDATEATLMDGTYFRRSWNYLLNSLYVYALKRWISLFPREQLLIIKSEDLYANSATVVQQTFKFLNLPEYQLKSYPKHYPGEYKSQPSDDIRQTLSEYFKPHNEQLEEFLGVQFNWS
ncbi:MAG: tetratricopeptide repeat protein [Leptolyngbyaceae cyanobacterium SM1_4_3]|nr:tetratricopeptide repeat protein [Leptolyngbyaceae cyanobacterium SM1_4_3]NJN92362.1 tetratricopeptide repeat protein [Leptolyngbyaceae cyanobacterium SL_5_14]